MRLKTLGFLQDIRTAAEFIAEDTSGATFETFLEDRRMRQLVERNFVTVGEAMNQLRHHDPEVAERISDLTQAVAFRNILVHGYNEIDYPTVWRAIQMSLPALRAEVEALFKELEV